jgi:hypothetical protein
MESHDRVNSLCDAIDVSVQTSNSAGMPPVKWSTNWDMIIPF